MSGTWRSAVASGIAATAVALTVVAGGVGAWLALRDYGDAAAKNSALDFADREVAWGNGWTLNQEALYAARSLIPRGADYQVAVGDSAKFENRLTELVGLYFHYFLMPRHPRAGAQWVVCYRCDQPAGTEVVWADGANGISILRRPRAET
jgi:hypothetical protein